MIGYGGKIQRSTQAVRFAVDHDRFTLGMTIGVGRCQPGAAEISVQRIRGVYMGFTEVDVAQWVLLWFIRCRSDAGA